MNLYTIIRHFRPQRFVEIGSGHSSKVTSGALAKNRHGNPSQAPEYKIIDPYPSEIISKLRAIAQLVKGKVECAYLKVFESLGNNDIVFVDLGQTFNTEGVSIHDFRCSASLEARHACTFSRYQFTLRIFQRFLYQPAVSSFLDISLLVVGLLSIQQQI